MDLVNFQVGAKTISLPILDILLTEQYNNDLTEVPNNNPNFIGVREFMGTPVPIFDLGLILNRHSTNSQNKEVIKQLKNLKQQSKIWLSSLSSELQGKDATQEHQHIEFSKWLNEFECDDEDLSTLLLRVKETLTATYEEFSELDDAKWPSKKATAASRLERLFDSAIEQVEIGYKPIIVFTTIDGREPHIGLLVDKVKDSIHVEEEDIKSLDAVTATGFELDPETSRMMKGLIQLDKKHSLIIETKRLFSQEQQAALA
ncbi:chemotaxis protein CheW [Psychrosphaera ytuae]|uniref:Chemotaxis protein CheW n=1 Tax=Psychrosphaera ytuae TaxID=2820710 RepID=A0A975HI51_9GAMM|nr:chemotaxis protein CheW [Psychrosphaera ytuae]QTH63855.1 chemotaxis protein CheW [Psychrosphaera ytuae]